MSRDEQILGSEPGSGGENLGNIGTGENGEIVSEEQENCPSPSTPTTPYALTGPRTPDPVNFSRQTARTWATIDLEALKGNVRGLQRAAGPDGTVQAVVKADGYGHGAVPVALACAEAGVHHFAVATLDEARELRSVLPPGVADVYMLSPFLPDEAEWVVRLDVIPMLSTPEQWMALADAAQGFPFPARCFLMLDTGMGREGANSDEAHWCFQAACEAGAVRITGIATHLASADEPDADSFTCEQVEVLRTWIQEWGTERLHGWDDGREEQQGIWLSLWNSPGILRRGILPELPNLGRGFLYRAGSVLYGVEPYPNAFVDLPELRPILSWQARITLVKELPAGATVGYGRTCTLHRPSRIATLAVGYADGFPRRLSNQGTVLLHGQRFPIVGRVSMDQCQIDVTDCRHPVRAGDIATLVGQDGNEHQTVLELATTIETTPHEPTCALSERVYRVYG